MITDYSKLFNDVQNLKMKQSSDTSKNWNKNNRVLFEGEIAYEKDTGRIKVGDGKSSYTELPYVCMAEDESNRMKYSLDSLISNVATMINNIKDLDNKYEKLSHDMYVLFITSFVSSIVFVLILAFIMCMRG